MPDLHTKFKMDCTVDFFLKYYRTIGYFSMLGDPAAIDILTRFKLAKASQKRSDAVGLTMVVEEFRRALLN